MKYEVFSLLTVGLLLFILAATRRWIRWPFSLRALYWCGAFSYIVLLALPRVFIFPGVDTIIRIAFWTGITILFAWILAYHNI